MLTALRIRNGCLEVIIPEENATPLNDSIWINLVNPTEEETAMVEAITQFSLPDIKETEELEASSHYAIYDNGFQVNCSFLQRENGRIKNTNVAFLLNNERLISLSAREIPVFHLLKIRYGNTAGLIKDSISILISLLEIKIDDLADILEEAYSGIETISHQVLERSKTELEGAIDGLAIQDDLNGQARLCLMDGQRDSNFLLRRGRLTQDNIKRVNDILGDIETLLSHNTFLSERVDFLLNAAMGFINIEQNKIIKIFSIAAVVFLPPTLIASIYGMNFHFMPELSKAWGYPLAIVLMIVSGISPYLYFKRKGWL